ncbi:ubiquitin carboxyl-terminal hydrolase 8-like [Stegodyphus dumicola]|uniref:ubiquitin carboxyl-terminal hydrolase 8-like n=1 Tax=Stegodyphus dumicola TaxID=202533 RepID=UPI0015B00183|nr:ubiquitin carboxyl-terminal hydrolase 8-like [Stegodyphus dumicola]
MLEEQMDKEFKKQKEKAISEAENQRKNLQEQVEKLRELRKKKEEMLAKNKAEFSKTDGVPRETVSANSALKRTTGQSQSSSKHSNASEYSVPLSRQTSSDSSSRGLVRSHSSPNIAQMVNQEENIQRKIPVIDRSLKPKVIPNYQLAEIHRARLRNLNPVYGNCPVRPATGLRNLGNTCFMNSIIQCLSNTIPLADYFTTGQYMDDINRDSRQSGEVAEEFAVVIRALWMGQYKSFSPKDFKNTVSRCLAVCIGNEQQDSHEFLVVLMEKLHADLNKRHGRSVTKLEESADENAFWQHHKSYNFSKISEIFEGLLKSTLTCLSCRKTSDNYEVFSCLSLPILGSRCSLKECFQYFLKSEKIYGEAAWDCPRCKQKKEAEKRLRICRLPNILVIQLKRFSYEGLWRRKLQTHVDFDLVLDVPCEENGEECLQSYSLYGIVNHYGTLEGGHYTAYCNALSNKWYKYDDHEVSEINVSDIKTSAAYILFYQAVNLHSNL